MPSPASVFASTFAPFRATVRPALALLFFGATLLSVVMPEPGVAQAPVPALTGRVVDQAGLLSPSAAGALGTLLETHEQQWGNQVVVLTLRSLEGEAIEAASMRIAESWALGSAEADNGVLILVAPNDRQMRIEVGLGLESTLTDLLAGRLVRNVFTPAFRQGDFEGGILRGAEALLGVLEGDEARTAELLEEPAADRWKGNLAAVVVVVVFVISYGRSGLYGPFSRRLFTYLLMGFWLGIVSHLFLPSRSHLVILLVAYTVIYWALSMSPGVRRARKRAGTDRWFGTSGSGRRGSSWSGGSRSSRGGFSGGGGSFGGGGSSGGW